jgi:hypothetical protein
MTTFFTVVRGVHVQEFDRRLARRLLRHCVKCKSRPRGTRLQFTIESRPLTKEYTHRPSLDGELKQTTIEAASADDAIGEFVRRSASELVSLTRPLKGSESIAMVRKDDSVFLVRVYEA